jgi:predicted adenylyl cyclase CyaB
MEKNLEVELKFQVLDELQTKNFLKNLKFLGEKRTIDVYLDTKDGDLYKRGIFIRIRDNKKLEFKFNLADIQSKKFSKHEHCDEFSFPLPLTRDSIRKINEVCRILGLKEVSSLEELKSKNNLIDSIIIDKVRQKFTDGKFEYSFDDVKDLGKFLEIEYKASSNEDMEKIKEEMREKLKGLNLKLITTGYNELYWRKNNFELYLQGRYLLEEDYEKYRKNITREL